MYSDFVGVTYNKTHAKYQACITHYRKQHYLGRYKLAVDAALAYDESARLLKGSSWKVNFQTRQEYEKAKAKELARVENNGGAAVDVAGSLAAVALKVEEIASTVAMSSGVMRSDLPAIESRNSFHSLDDRRHGTVEETGDEKGTTESSERNIMLAPKLPPPHEKSTLLNTKVTPSPTFQMNPPLCSEQQGESASPSITRQPQSSLVETPLQVSPNPSRHMLGNEKSTPDSVIRPTVLTYRPIDECCPKSNCSSGRRPLPQSRGPIEEKAVTIDQEAESMPADDAISGLSSNGKDFFITTSTPLHLASISASSPRAVPPVIQNGTLAAASALMTLFGNERSPQD